MEIKNLKKVAQRISQALKKNEPIGLFADADLDGTTSAILIEETIKNLRGRISFLYFLDREKEDYGLNEKALKFLKKYAPALLILLDCGIASFQGIEKAKDLGFQVIVIDHHEILEKLPATEFIIDPKQKDDFYPFKYLATCGLCFKLAKLLLQKKISQNIEKNFLELVALGTIADKMPQIEDNKILINQGLSYLPFSFRPGLKLFFKKFSSQNYSLLEIVQKIINTLQIVDLKNHLTESYLFLSSSDEKKANQLLKILLAKSAKRSEIINLLIEKTREKVLKNNSSFFIFEGGEEYLFILTGAIATRISNEFKKPTFIYARKKDLIRGSVRTLENFNSVEVLKFCSQWLKTYGGHPVAGGFSLKKENLENFKDCLWQYFKRYEKNNHLY